MIIKNHDKPTKKSEKNNLWRLFMAKILILGSIKFMKLNLDVWIYLYRLIIII